MTLYMYKYIGLATCSVMFIQMFRELVPSVVSFATLFCMYESTTAHLRKWCRSLPDDYRVHSALLVTRNTQQLAQM